MERFISLNLREDSEKAQQQNVPKPEAETKEPEDLAQSKRLHQMLNKAAHKAATRGGGGGIFSK
ncbi:MAG TPA: hypothetical protein VGF82_07795 [Terracidiphilus sp.]|jgi:hypothetical protein